MEYEYDDSVHLHLDYFGTECDMESIAYKRKNEDVWDVYFNFWSIWSSERWDRDG